ncbi:hypothetical protein Tco_0703265 [Tanacetum coccineum]|uniref:Uncharacterized protein n=1 Tax=Tanacetum coccineum TaxID=301880 RepID=A0ABQ4XYG9_9ASTR
MKFNCDSKDMELDEEVGYTTNKESVTSEHEAIKPDHTVNTQSFKEELSSEEDLDEWLNAEIEKHLRKQEEKNEEDALIAIIKSIREECRTVFYDDGSGEDCGMWPTCDPNSSFCYGYKELKGSTGFAAQRCNRIRSSKVKPDSQLKGSTGFPAQRCNRIRRSKVKPDSQLKGSTGFAAQRCNRIRSSKTTWPTIEENEVTRPRKYSELSATDAIQADCDVKATNIILQGLPPEDYTLCKLYDEFDKFAYKKGETLHDFYLIFSLLLNDMNIYYVKLEQFQVNTKFLNTLPPEWSKFVTYAKLVQDLHTTNIDQLHAYLGQHEFHANEVRLMHERNSDPLALSPQYGSPYQSQQYSNNQSSTPLSITYPSNDYQSSVHHNVYSPPSSIPQMEYVPTVNQQQQQPEFPQLDSGLTVLVFKQGDDPIDAINHMMSFLSVVVTSRYPTTNNQLRNSSNPRQQATINDGRVTLQPVQGRQISFATGTTRTYTPGASGSNSGKQRTVICYNCKGEGHHC